MTDGQEAVLLGGAVAATAGSAYLFLRVTEAADTYPWLFLGLPLIPAATTCLLGSAMELDGNCGRAFQASLLSALPGYALIGLGLGMESWDRVGFLVFGGLGLLIPPPFFAVDSYRVRVAPTVVSASGTGRVAPGLHLHIGL